MQNKTQKPQKGWKLDSIKIKTQKANWLRTYSFVTKAYFFLNILKTSSNQQQKNQAIQEEIKQRLWVGS